MLKERKLTTIELPHGVLSQVGHILEAAGFKLGTVGSGMGEMERDGEIGNKEAAELSRKMGEVLFGFEVQDINPEVRYQVGDVIDHPLRYGGFIVMKVTRGWYWVYHPGDEEITKIRWSWVS